MPFSAKLNGRTDSLRLPHSRHPGWNRFTATSISALPKHRCFQKLGERFSLNKNAQRVFAVEGGSNAHGSFEFDNRASDVKSSRDKNEDSLFQGPSLKTSMILKTLQLCGIYWILSYILLTIIDYIPTYLCVRFCIAPASDRFVKLMAVLWAANQVTQLLRVGGLLLLLLLVTED